MCRRCAFTLAPSRRPSFSSTQAPHRALRLAPDHLYPPNPCMNADSGAPGCGAPLRSSWSDCHGGFLVCVALFHAIEGHSVKLPSGVSEAQRESCRAVIRGSTSVALLEQLQLTRSGARYFARAHSAPSVSVSSHPLLLSAVPRPRL